MEDESLLHFQQCDLPKRTYLFMTSNRYVDMIEVHALVKHSMHAIHFTFHIRKAHKARWFMCPLGCETNWWKFHSSLPVREACSARSVVVLSAIILISAGTFSPTRISTISPGSRSLAGSAAICTTLSLLIYGFQIVQDFLWKGFSCLQKLRIPNFLSTGIGQTWFPFICTYAWRRTHSIWTCRELFCEHLDISTQILLILTSRSIWRCSALRAYLHGFWKPLCSCDSLSKRAYILLELQKTSKMVVSTRLCKLGVDFLLTSIPFLTTLADSGCISFNASRAASAFDSCQTPTKAFNARMSNMTPGSMYALMPSDSSPPSSK